MRLSNFYDRWKLVNAPFRRPKKLGSDLLIDCEDIDDLTKYINIKERCKTLNCAKMIYRVPESDNTETTNHFIGNEA